jgi:hydrogenase maturation protease
MSRRSGIQLQADEGPAGIGRSAARGAGLVEDLRQAVRRLRALPGRVLVVGVGNPARGDDGVGPAVVEELAGWADGCGTVAPGFVSECGEGPAALDVGDAPERYLGPIAESGAGVVLFVDAVDFRGQPGQAVLLQEQDLPARSCATHRSSLGLVMRYLREQAGQHCLVLGVQPATIAPGAAMTDPVRTAISGIAAAIRMALGEGRPR